jgi:hypothetical protein
MCISTSDGDQRREPTVTAATDALLAVGVWPSTRRLRAALRANAVFSLACGVTLAAVGWWLAES